ncbi:MAG: tetrapyrrole methylase family protein/MazG family protein [Candidatus Omnitrophota bacterium]|jgi:tetrapyrrole methylase family protein / MazG family protein
MTAPIDRLLDIMATLRSEQGCPWDREQNLTTLKPYLIEEAYEVLDAIDRGDVDQHREELGDLLLQVVFQSQITKEAGQFAFDDVANAISDKLVRRHPHVFGDVAVSGSDEVLTNWDAIKREEKAEAGKTESALDSVPKALPALMRAHELQKRAARLGFDWPDASDVLPKFDEELAEIKEAIAAGDEAAIAEELGDLLFTVVNFARKKKLRSEDLLQAANQKFSRRFHAVEALATERGLDMKSMSLQELDGLWDEVKAVSRS